LIDSETQRHLLDNIAKARELGAVVVRLQSADPVLALLDYARAHGVGHIMVGRSHRPRWQRRLGRTFIHRMLEQAADFDLHIVALDDGESRA
jgi:two-component system sensor histidine kinase KdpD